MPQPNLVPVRPRSSLKTHSSGFAESTSTEALLPFTTNEIVFIAFSGFMPAMPDRGRRLFTAIGDRLRLYSPTRSSSGRTPRDPGAALFVLRRGQSPRAPGNRLQHDE